MKEFADAYRNYLAQDMNREDGKNTPELNKFLYERVFNKGIKIPPSQRISFLQKDDTD